MPTQGFHLFLALLFVALNAFFVASEFALVKIRVTRLEVLAKRGNRIAELAQHMVDHLDPYLSATQLGITLASLGLGWVGEPAFSKLLFPFFQWLGVPVSLVTLHSLALTFAFLVISALHIILGELVPKSIAIQTAEKVCLLVAVPLQIFYVLFFPFLWSLNALSNAFLKLIRFRRVGGMGRAPTEEELKLIFEDSFEEGALDPRKKMLLEKGIDFSHKTVREIMVPRDQIVYLSLRDSVHDNLQRAKESGHTRFPLYEKKNGRILGYVHMKDVIWSLEHGDVINLFDLARPIIFFSPETKLDTALREFQRKKIHIGIVEEVPGKVLGLITLENVIEQLVGQIDDEFDL